VADEFGDRWSGGLLEGTPMRAKHHLAAWLCIGAICCARGGTASNSAGQSQDVAVGHQAAAQLIGHWDLASDPPQALPGLRMGFAIDSASRYSYFGRLSFYMAGNAGANAGDFEPFADTMGQDESVRFRAAHGNPSISGILVVGQLRGDTIHVETLVIGPDTLSRQQRKWFLVKR
jgi:hypothetical protein